MPFSFWNDIPRLAAGSVQTNLLWYCVRLTFGLEPWRKDEGWPEWTCWCRWDELAERIRCSTRAVQEEAKELSIRKVIAVEHKRGQVRFTLLHDSWGDLSDYESVPKPVLVIQKSTEPVKVLEKPFTVKAGRRSKPISIPGWEKEVAFQGGKNDCEVSVSLESDTRLVIGTTVLESENYNPVESDTSAIDRKHRSETKAKVSVPKLILESCAAYGLTSETGILQMVAACRSNAPGCSSEEIAERITFVGSTASQKVRSIPALIRVEVPKYFNSEAYKQGLKAGRKPPGAVDPEYILNNPHKFTTKDIAWAKTQLGYDKEVG